MHLLRHFTIRRVVLWMMLISLGVVACAGGYSALTLRDIYRHADRADELTQQLTFLTRSGIVMQSGTAAEKIALISSIPESTDWDDFRRALATTPADYAPAARARLDALTLHLASCRRRCAGLGGQTTAGGNPDFSTAGRHNAADIL